MPDLRVAVVGSGPAGVYATGALTRADGVSVDVLDRLPAPYGLVRYGVAPDHVKMKSVDVALRKVLEQPSVRFLGNVEVGTDVTLAELRRHYDAVLFATGAAVDRRLGVPGEDLAGSFSATDFVAWYSGHPDAELDRFTLRARRVVVIGVGNVAVDVARVLSKTAAELSPTDVPGHVLDLLDASAVEEVTVVGRRGPAQAKFTTKELRELGELANADVLVDAADLELSETDAATVEADRTLRANLEVLREWSTRQPAGRPRRLRLRFWLRPVEVLGVDAVSGLRAERSRLDASGRLLGTGETVDLPAEMVLRSVGYRAVPLPGLPFDERAGVVPHAVRSGAHRGRPDGRRVRRRLDQARPDRRHRHQQVGRGGDRRHAARRRAGPAARAGTGPGGAPGAARRPGRALGAVDRLGGDRRRRAGPRGGPRLRPGQDRGPGHPAADRGRQLTRRVASVAVRRLLPGRPRAALVAGAPTYGGVCVRAGGGGPWSRRESPRS